MTRAGSSLIIGLPAALAMVATTRAAEQGSLLSVVQGYADTMLERGRDTYGPQPSGLLLSALDRLKLAPLTTRPASPHGVRRGDRSGPAWEPLTGANPHLDQNLLRVLYVLSEMTGEPRYAEAADHELKWFLENTQSPVTGLLPWGEHLCWEVMTDRVVSHDNDAHEFARPWMLWERCYELAPEPCRKFALGLWEHQIADHRTGAFDRHAPYSKHGPRDGMDFPRHGGFYIGTWAHAYKQTQDEVFLRAIETVLARFERKRTQKDGSQAATIGPLEPHAAAALVPDPLASRLRSFALKEDELIIQSLRTPEGAFKPVEATWTAGYSSGTAASQAMFYLGRYEQVPNPVYRDLLIAVANAYVDSRPAEDVDAWPMSFGHAISLEVAAYRMTGKPLYLQQAQRLARLAVELYWQDNPLPRASLRTGHYESITGPDSLALALLEVHAAENKLEVPLPSNTIDR